jgi:hypothetical protein
MVLRNGAIAIIFAALAMGSGCSAETDDAGVGSDISSTESAAKVDCDTIDSCPDDDLPPKATVGTLSSYSPATGALEYVVAGQTYLVTVLASTQARVAPLNFWPPDPIRPIAERWNDLVSAPGPSKFGDLTGGGETFSSLTSEFVASGALMKVKLDPNRTTVKALRPVF